MKTRWTGSQSWTTLLTIFVGGLILVGFVFPKEVRIVPFVIGFPTLILLIILWVGGFYPRVIHWVEGAMGDQRGGKSKDTGGAERSLEFTEWKPVLVIIGGIFIFYAFVFLLGFVLVSPVFMASFLIRKGGLNWLAAILYSAIAILLIYTGVTGLLKVDLWSGVIPSIIPGILGGSIVPPL